MRKLVILSLVLAICLLGATQLALAAEAAVSPEGSRRTCFLNLLPDDAREQVEQIIAEYYEKMLVLREKMQESRIAGDRESLVETRRELWNMKEEQRDAIAPYIPEEFCEEYACRGAEKRRNHRPAEHIFKHGWNKGNGFSSRAGLQF